MDIMEIARLYSEIYNEIPMYPEVTMNLDPSDDADNNVGE